jgi:hypothetical protein
MDYYYPKVSGGYRWNMLKRCLWEVGIEPIGSGDIGEQTCLTFDRELTTTEKTKLDNLMADNPTFPPSSGVTVVIRDLWEEFEGFKTACGLPDLRIFFVEATTGSGIVNRIKLWHPTPLTATQKTNVKTAYQNLWIG